MLIIPHIHTELARHNNRYKNFQFFTNKIENFYTCCCDDPGESEQIGFQHNVRGEIIIIIIITDLYSAFRSEETEALDAAQED